MLLSHTGIEEDRLKVKPIEGGNFCWGCILHGAQQRRNTEHVDISYPFFSQMTLDLENSYARTKNRYSTDTPPSV